MSKPSLKLKLKCKRTNRFTNLSSKKPMIKRNPIRKKEDFCFKTFDQFKTKDDEMLNDLMAVVDSSVKKGSRNGSKETPRSRNSIKKHNLRYSNHKKEESKFATPESEENSPKRGRSLPPKAKQDLIRLLNQEKIVVPCDEKSTKKERKRSLIVISERFLNTKGSKPFIPEEKITTGIYKKVSEISTDCKSAHRGANPYDDQCYSRKRCRSSNPTKSTYLDNLDDMTPQKLDFTKSPSTIKTNSNSKPTPAKRSKSTLKIKISQSPVSYRNGKCEMQKVIIPKRRLSADRKTKGGLSKLCPKLKIKRRDSSVEKLCRIAQTEKKPKQNNSQLKKYQPLSSVCKQHSAAKEQVKIFYNRELRSGEKEFIKNPDIQFHDRTRDTMIEEEKIPQKEASEVKVCFGGISEATQREFKNNILVLNEYDETSSDMFTTKYLQNENKENQGSKNGFNQRYSSPDASHHELKSTKRRKREEYSLRSPEEVGDAINEHNLPSYAKKLQF